MTVGELCERMSLDEFVAWSAYFEVQEEESERRQRESAAIAAAQQRIQAPRRLR